MWRDGREVDDNVGLDRRFYVAELPVRTSLGVTTVVALDSHGAVIATTSLRWSDGQGQKAACDPFRQIERVGPALKASGPRP